MTQLNLKLDPLINCLNMVKEHYQGDVGSIVADSCVEAARVLEALKDPSDSLLMEGVMQLARTPSQKEISNAEVRAIFSGMINQILEDGA